MPTKPKKDDPLEPIMLSISQLTDEQRSELFDELEEVYCVSCGENVTDLEDDEEHDCPCPEEDDEDDEDDKEAPS